MSKKEETEKLKNLLEELIKNQGISKKSRKNLKGMLETVKVAEKGGFYLSSAILRQYLETTKGLKKTQSDGIDTVYT